VLPRFLMFSELPRLPQHLHETSCSIVVVSYTKNRSTRKLSSYLVNRLEQLKEGAPPSSSQCVLTPHQSSTAGDRTLNNDGERESYSILDNKLVFISRGLISAVSSKICRIRELT
jgi:hypothetical protein